MRDGSKRGLHFKCNGRGKLGALFDIKKIDFTWYFWENTKDEAKYCSVYFLRWKEISKQNLTELWKRQCLLKKIPEKIRDISKWTTWQVFIGETSRGQMEKHIG